MGGWIAPPHPPTAKKIKINRKTPLTHTAEPATNALPTTATQEKATPPHANLH